MFVKTGNLWKKQLTFCLLGIVASDLVHILLQATSQGVTGTLSVALSLCKTSPHVTTKHRNIWRSGVKQIQSCTYLCGFNLRISLDALLLACRNS
jgi:hypothetical protein